MGRKTQNSNSSSATKPQTSGRRQRRRSKDKLKVSGSHQRISKKNLPQIMSQATAEAKQEVAAGSTREQKQQESPVEHEPIDSEEQAPEEAAAAGNEQVNGENEEDYQEEEEESYGCGACSSSDLTLRRLRLDASEDVAVCEQNRDSTEAARCLFERLGQQQQKEKQTNSMKQVAVAQRGSGLSVDSHNQKQSRNQATGDRLSAGESPIRSPESSGSSGRLSSSNEDDGDETCFASGIKLIKRSESSVSAASSNFRRTLVCSVSPSSRQLSNSTGSISTSSQLMIPSSVAIYPMDGDEMRQCKAAFRENKRLIELQQLERDLAAQQEVAAAAAATTGSCTNKQWALRFSSNSLERPSCSHCNQRLYPVDKMELDFTKTTLNIHRNCFKCQVCSTLLRLETYAAIDAKLYCPTHIKLATKSAR